MTKQLLIFDLDGTLMDTADDLATSVNLMLAEFGLPTLDTATVTTYVGDGARMLIQRALAGAPVNIDDALALQRRFYREHLTDCTTLYPGVAEGLPQLRRSGHVLAVASNKTIEGTDRILGHFKLRSLFDVVLGDGSTPRLKPHPDMLERIMTETGVQTSATWMIGDNYTDLAAARLAHVGSILVTYGFGNPRDETPTLKAASFAEITARFC
jgi:phosphoglycolate phosphatase